jgi:single-strand DNA-binding protein
MNQLTIIGFTGQDADFHYTPNGTSVTTFSVATKESWKNDKGEWQSRTDWHRVATFGKLAEYTITLSKATHVMVQGSLRSREYESDGVQRRIFELRADTVAKLDRAERREDESNAFRYLPLLLECRMVSLNTIVGTQRRDRFRNQQLMFQVIPKF